MLIFLTDFIPVFYICLLLKSITGFMIIRYYYSDYKAWLFSIAVALIPSCKDPFVPNLVFKQTNFLVIEGYINVGADAITTIRLSRTVPVNEELTGPLMEKNAVIFVEDELGNSYSLTEQSAGVYTSGVNTLPIDRKYRILISTADENEYTSEFVSPIQTPEIDSVSWAREVDGVAIDVATHDAQENTHYYQWDYEEIWEIHSVFPSFYGYSNGVLYRLDNEQILNMNVCWKRATPSNLLTRSTAALNDDAISVNLINIPSDDEKFSENYSVLVKQHALSREAFDYLQVMSKNTNQVGTFFDPQPAQLIGNISARNSNEPVVGYMGAYTTSEQRIYIKKGEVPDWNFSLLCQQDIFLVQRDTLEKYIGSGIYTPLMYTSMTHTDIFAGTPLCADCRKRGGNNNKPPFWAAIFE
jgi:hypothetical protein